MKNLKKIFVVLLVTMMASTMLISCGGPKTSPEESTKIFLDVVLKDDKTNMDKIGINEEDYTTFKKEKEDGFMKGFEGTGLDSSILTDEIKTKFKNDILKGLATLSYEVAPVSEEKDTANVDVKIKAFDMEKISTDAQNKIIKEVTDNPNMTETEMYKEMYKLIGEAIAAGTVKQDLKTVSMTLTKKDNIWLPNDNDIDVIMSAIMAE